VGPAQIDAARQAVDRGVRVYTIGFGTAEGLDRPCCPEQFLGAAPPGARNILSLTAL